MWAAPGASATALFRASGMYSSVNIGGDEGNRLLLDLNPAYVRDSGWAFGVTYQTDKYKSGPTVLATTSIGASVGLFTRRELGFYGVATYFPSSTRDDDRTGTGYQADLGYRFQLRRISYALQFSYKHFAYAAPHAGGGTLEVSRIDPYFGFWFEY